MKYLVQAILQDGDIETVVDSIKTDDWENTVDFVMRRHKSNYHYLYTVLDIETKEVLLKQIRNKFWL